MGRPREQRVKAVLFSPLETDGAEHPAGNDAASLLRSHSFGKSYSSCGSEHSEHEDGDDFALLELEDTATTSPRLITLVASTLDGATGTARASSQAGASPSRTSPFHGVRPPPIRLEVYMERITKYTKCSPVCLVMCLVYMDILAQKDSSLQPALLSVHRLVVTGVMLAAKFTDDHYFNNAFYAKVGGISVQELNRLELSMLSLLDFRLCVSHDMLRHFLRLLQQETLVLGSGVASLPVPSLHGGRKRRSVSGCGERRTHRRPSEGAPMETEDDSNVSATDVVKADALEL